MIGRLQIDVPEERLCSFLLQLRFLCRHYMYNVCSSTRNISLGDASKPFPAPGTGLQVRYPTVQAKLPHNYIVPQTSMSFYTLHTMQMTFRCLFVNVGKFLFETERSMVLVYNMACIGRRECISQSEQRIYTYYSQPLFRNPFCLCMVSSTPFLCNLAYSGA